MLVQEKRHRDQARPSSLEGYEKEGKGSMKLVRYGIIAAIVWYIWKRYKDAQLPEYTLPRLHE